MTFTYASDGSLVSKSDGTDTWTYEWDYERRLAAFKKNSAILVEYSYNPTGTRRQASDATLGVENYFHSRGHVLADYNFNWTLTKSYILGPSIDEIIAMIDRTTDPNVTHYFTCDRLGSTSELVNASETINTRYGYDAWGGPAETQLASSVSTRYQFTGRSFDSTSGLYNYRARHYDHGVGRFTSRDPLYSGTRRHVDSYVYVGNNPATMVDPMGLMGQQSVTFEPKASYEAIDGDADFDCCRLCCWNACQYCILNVLAYRCTCTHTPSEKKCRCRCTCEGYESGEGIYEYGIEDECQLRAPDQNEHGVCEASQRCYAPGQEERMAEARAQAERARLLAQLMSGLFVDSELSPVRQP